MKQINDRLNKLGIRELLTNKSYGFGISDPAELSYYADYFEKINHLDDSYFWALDALKTKIRVDRNRGFTRSFLEYGAQN